MFYSVSSSQTTSQSRHQTIFIYRLFFIILAHWTSLALGGVCWEMFDESSSVCRKVINTNTTFAECCGLRGLATTSWSPHTLPSDIFYFNFLAGGADQCHRCHNTCDTVTCEEGKTCRMQSGVPRCVCQSYCDAVDKVQGRVCGSDGNIYRDLCHLKKMNCITDSNVQVEYFGKCRNSCRHVSCEGDKHCLEDQNGSPHCVQCNVECGITPGDQLPVCGVNGRTYRNTCDLKAAICREGRSIRIAYHGPCNPNATCKTFQCPKGETCLTNPANGQPACSQCDTFCLVSAMTKVCGTDGRTYNNYCHMKMASCIKRELIVTRRSGSCKKRQRQRSLDKLKASRKSKSDRRCKLRHEKSEETQTRKQRRRHKKRKQNKKNKNSRKTKQHTRLHFKDVKYRQHNTINDTSLPSRTRDYNTS